MDELKRFVDDHRDDFELPASDGFGELWGDIEKGIEDREKKSKRIPLFSSKAWKIAAMVVLALGLAWVAHDTSEPKMAGTNSEWQETESFYETQIDEKMQALEAKRSELDHAVFDDLEMLDKAFKELKEDLEDNADNEEVIEAMIQNYRIKLQLLEEILQEIGTDETKNSDKVSAA